MKAALLVAALGAAGFAHAAEAQVAGQFQAQPQAAATGQFQPREAEGYGRPLQAAGLSAPAPFSTNDLKPTTADATLDEARAKDSRRGLSWFYTEATGGFEHVGLAAFKPSDTSLGGSILPTVQSGGAVGGGIGARVVYLTVGGEGRVGIFSAWKLGRVGGALGLRLPFGLVEPAFSVSGGYAGLAGLSGPVTKLLSVHGGYARASAGLDVYPVSRLSIGAATSFDLMALQRPKVSMADLASLPAGTIADADAARLASDGSSLGATFAVTAVVGLHL